MSTDAATLVAAAAASTVSGLFLQRARIGPERIAVDDGARRFDYRNLQRRTPAMRAIWESAEHAVKYDGQVKGVTA